MAELLYIIISGFIISLIALIGIFALSLRDKVLNQVLMVLVALSAGTLIGGAFFHLLPESIEEMQGVDIFPFVLLGYLMFFIVENFLHWHHCHKKMHDKHTFHYMNLIGDTIHNFIDGLIIAASFVVSIPLGLATSIAVAAHEIPQEIGDFGVLVYGGFTKKKALILNFIVALSVIIGGIVGFFVSQIAEEATMFLLPFAAGGFIYVAATDLIPEIRKETDIRKSIMVLEFFILGILLMLLVKVMFHHAH
jgi:zinc and cadmium transporter